MKRVCFDRSVLKNKMEFVHIHHSTNLISSEKGMMTGSIGFRINTGILNDPIHLTGLNHLIEHLVSSFLMTNYNKIMMENTIEYNAHTCIDNIFYCIYFPHNKLNKIFSSVLSAMINFDFDPEMINREANIVMNEKFDRCQTQLKRQMLDIGCDLYEKYFENTIQGAHCKTFMNSPRLKELITPDLIKNYMEYYYQPQNMSFYLYGDYEDSVVEKIKYSLFDLKNVTKDMNPKIDERSILTNRILNEHKQLIFTPNYFSLSNETSFAITFRFLMRNMNEIYEYQHTFDIMVHIINDKLKEMTDRYLSGCRIEKSNFLINYVELAINTNYLYWGSFLKELFKVIKSIEKCEITSDELTFAKNEKRANIRNFYYGNHTLVNVFENPTVKIFRTNENELKVLNRVNVESIGALAKKIFTSDNIHILLNNVELVPSISIYSDLMEIIETLE
jgi:hypothetical protein